MLPTNQVTKRNHNQHNTLETLKQITPTSSGPNGIQKTFYTPMTCKFSFLCEKKKFIKRE